MINTPVEAACFTVSDTASSTFDISIDISPRETAALCIKAGAEYPNGYLFVTMGAGDNWKVAQKILADGGLAIEGAAK